MDLVSESSKFGLTPRHKSQSTNEMKNKAPSIITEEYVEDEMKKYNL